MRAGECCVSAEIDLDRRREPAELENSAIEQSNKRCLREIHLSGDGLHPCFLRSTIEKTDRGGIPAESFAGECINLKYWNGHKKPAVPLRWLCRWVSCENRTRLSEILLEERDCLRPGLLS